MGEVPGGSSGVDQAANIFNLDLLPYDIGRIEVLRGPQGTLYGAGAIGGLLKYVTRAPDLLDSEFRFGAGLSSMPDGEQGWNARFGASLPLQDNRLDRKSVVEGKSVSVRVGLGGRRIIKKKNKNKTK